MARGMAPTSSDIVKRAEELGVDPKLALSFWSQESSGNFNSPDSNRGAKGGFQVISPTYRSMMGTSDGERDPWNNMEAGLRYIKYGQDTLKTRDPELLAAGYHSGYDRKSLKAGIIPNTNDGSISTADYARQVAARVRGERLPKRTASVDDQFSDTPVTPALSADSFSDTPVTPSAQEDTPKAEQGSFAGDVGRLTKSGLDTAAQDVRELVGRIPLIGQPIVKGADAVDKYFSGKTSEELLKDDQKAMQEGMTPEMQGALQKKWWDSEKGTFGSAWTDPRAYIGGVVQSLPEQAITMVPAMRLAKYAYGAKIAAGATAEAASAAAARTATIAGGVGEGLLGGAQSSREVRDEIMSLKPEVLAQSEAYNSLLKSGMKPEEAQTTLANDAATRAFVTSGVTTGLFGGMGDRAIAKIFTEHAGKLTAKKVVGNMAKGAVSEGVLEEAPQSALQQMSQNEAMQKAVPSTPLMKDVANQALGGMAIGGLQGGGMAAAASRSSPAPVPTAPEAPVIVPIAPSAESGPLGRATEKAAAPVERVTVTAPDGQVSGTVTGHTQDGSAVQVTGDDGQVYTFATSDDGIKITPEKPNTPLTNAVEAAADAHAEVQATAPQATAPQEAPAPEAKETPPAHAPEPAPVKTPKLADMDKAALRERLRYISEQAKASGGWDKRLVEQRRMVSAEIDKRAPKAKQTTYQQRNADRLNRVKQAKTQAEFDEITAKEHSDDERDFTGTKGLQRAINERKFALKNEAADAEENARYEAGEWVNVKETGSRSEAEQDAAKAQAEDPANEYRIGIGQDDGWTVKKRKKSAPSAVAAAAPEANKWFGSKEKADAYIAKKKLGDAYEVTQTGKVRFEITPKKDVNVTDERTSGQPASAEAVVQKANAGQAEASTVQPNAAPSKKEVSNQFKSYEKAIREGKASAGMVEQINSDERLNDGEAERLTAMANTETPAATEEAKPTTLAERRAKAKAEAAPAKEDVTTAEQGKPEPAAVDATPLQRTEAEIAEWKWRRSLPVNVGQHDFIDGEIAKLEEVADLLKNSETIDAAAPVADTKPAEQAVADPFANNKLFTSDAVAKARARMKSKLGQLNSGLDPELMMDGMTIAGAYIESGVRTFSAYSKAMIDDFGPKIKPYLLSFYEASRNYPGVDTEGMSTVAEAKSEFDTLLKGADLSEVKEAIGETVAKPAKRTKKTGSSSDATLTQDFGVEHIDGYGDGTRETGNATKDAFLKDARKYLKAVADVLTQRGFMVHTDRKGKPMSPVSVNESGMAGSGDVSLALKLPDAGSGIYVHVGDTALRGMVPMTTSGITVMFRATTEKDPYGGRENRWAPTDLSAADFADMLEQEARRYAKEINNGPEKLDQPGSRELEGKQSDALQGAEPQREAGDGAQGSGGADLFGGERAGSERTQPAGRLGNDAGEVSTLASRRDAGRGGEQGRKPVQRGERAAKQNPAIGDRDAGNQPGLIPQDGTRAQDRADGFVITDEDAIGEGGAKTKFKQNVAAIRLLKELTAANRQATRAEQAVLAKYVGWGGIPQAFERDAGAVTKGWEKEAAELKDVMTPDELAAAAASTRNAHYTSPEIVSAVWDAVKRFGFQGGRTVEPSVGVGNFFGLMPTALRSASQLTGVELDHITGGIAKQLYPQANIAAPVGFQDFSAPDNYFDLAIGNPPFGREGIYDPTRKKISGFSIHNYFFAKSVDTVRPNGVLAMVVTNRLLDSMGDKARSYIADRTEFLGAIRLPNDAFLKNAGTQVTTDIIFLRKLKEGEQLTGKRWMGVKQYTDKDGKTVPLNEYFVANPDMMLGDFGAYGSMYSPDDAALVARPGQDTPALLQAAIAKLPQGFMDGPTAEPVRETVEPMHDVSHVKIGSVFEQGGKIFERREDLLGKQQAAPVTFTSDKAQERVSGMIGVRDALIDVRGLQLQEGVSEKELNAARAKLNTAYDVFVKANGPLNADANKRLMRDDPTWPQIAALEDKFDKGISATVAKTTGEKPRPPSAQKSAIFSKRTQAPYKAPEKANSAKDAMVSSLSERGRVDLDYMATLYGKTPEQIAGELAGLIYKNPNGGWESRDQYLSGNVKKKLAQAIDAAKADPSLKGNVDALKAVQPADIEAVDIDVKTGAHWIPADVMKGFITHVSEGQNPKATYNPVSASWSLSVERVPQSAMTQWSTDRANILAVLEAASNQKQITIYDKHNDGSRTLNEGATTAANEKVERVKAEWKNWIWSDDARRERLARIYNDTFNTDVQREYDGLHLTFPGKVGDDIIRLYPHQANAVWRMVQSGTTLLDHVVGAGKTFTMIAGIMEMRRMGLAKKPMLVVPNHLVGQWSEDFMKLYPGANILAATKKDFEKDSRKRLFARIATGDWDAVIVAHSSFGKVEVAPEFQAEFIKQQISDMDTSIAAMREAEGKGSRNVKQIEKQKATLEEKLKKLFDTGSKDDNLHFGELGVDAVLLDEAHEFKNLGFSTSMQRVAGLGNPAGSNKAADMFMKVQSTLQRTGGKNVVFATGTPISNTMAEMYTMQRFLDYATLKEQGIAHFDAWAKTFGEVVTDWELSPSGQYKMNSRFAKFVNMPELMQRYGSFADVINRNDINRQLAVQGKTLPVPKVKGGKPENIVVERSRDQAQFIGIPTVDENGVENYPEGSLVYRAENLPKKVVKGSDNMLKIMSDARKAALDMRLIDPSFGDNPGSKINVSADSIKSIYDKWTPKKGTQLVFIDLSTPKGAMAKEAARLRELVKLAEEGDEASQEKLDAMSPDELLALDGSFSVYDDLKAKLIARGIPENEIAFIHDANTEIQKSDLFGKVRSGRVRVLFGSTAKMGAGMNVQERLVALHHLDAPWRPSDLEQREGRIIRQGNVLYDADPSFEVEIKRYATKQTLDSRMWQTIEAKARFIEQVRKGTGEREVEDVAGEASNSAEMKAASSGNPLILEEMSLRQAIRKLDNQQSEHNREQYRIKDRMRLLADAAKSYDRQAVELNADAPLAPAEFTLTVGKQSFDKVGEAGDAILAQVNAMHAAQEESRDIGSYGGFKLTIDDTSHGLDLKAIVTLRGNGEYQVDANPGSSGVGLGQRIANTVRNLKSEADRVAASAQRNRDDIPKLQAQVKPWGHEAELNDAKARHAAVIEQLKPKKKPDAAKAEASKPDGDVRTSRADDLESVFAALESRGLARKRALDSLDSRSDADVIRYIEDNWFSILGELDDSGKVTIKC